MRKILITNDDGIRSEGLLRLVRTALPFGEVWVIAPDGQRSGSAQSITLHSHIDLYPYEYPVEGVRAFSCSGTPVDCIRVGCLSVMPQKPDVVLTGINFGFNVATDLQYSATAGGAFEAAFQGFRSIAFSEDASPDHAVTDAHLPAILEKWIDRPLGPGQILNVNFPCCSLSEFRGILEDRKVSRGSFYRDHYIELAKLEKGGVRLMVEGVLNREAEEGTDFRAVVENYISVGIVDNVGSHT